MENIFLLIELLLVGGALYFFFFDEIDEEALASWQARQPKGSLEPPPLRLNSPLRRVVGGTVFLMALGLTLLVEYFSAGAPTPSTTPPPSTSTTETPSSAPGPTLPQPELAGIEKEVVIDEGDTEMAKGFAAWNSGNLEEAYLTLKRFHDSVNSDPNDSRAIRSGYSLSILCYNLAVTAFKHGYRDAGFNYFHESIEFFPPEDKIRELGFHSLEYTKADLENQLRQLESQARAEDSGKRGKLSPRELQELKARQQQEEQSLQQSLAVKYTRHFDVAFDRQGSDGEDLREIFDTLERGFRDTTELLNFFPGEPIKVFIYRDRDFEGILNAPHWAGALFDGAIKIPARNIRKMSDEARDTLIHELTHALIHLQVENRVPTWLNEGMAQFIPRHLARRPYEADPILGLNKDRLFPLETLAAGGWTRMEANAARLAYAEAEGLVNHLHERFRLAVFEDILRSLAAGQDLEGALQKATRFSGEQLFESWKRTL